MIYNKQLDGLRCVAVVSIMVFHWLQTSSGDPFFKMLPLGSGVVLFFIISGFIITKILLMARDENEKSRVAPAQATHLASIKAFYVRRVLRIFPVYYATIACLYFLDMPGLKPWFPWLWTYTLNFKMAQLNEFPPHIFHFWSLAVEEQFYLFWPFLIFYIPKKHLMKSIVLLVLVSLASKYYLQYFTRYWMASNALVFSNMFYLGGGALLAFTAPPKTISIDNVSRGVKLTGLMLVVLFIAGSILTHGNVLHKFWSALKPLVLWGIFSTWVFLAGRNQIQGVFKRILENRAVNYLGKISYTLYVLHVFIPGFYDWLFPKVTTYSFSGWEYFALYSITNIFCASLSWHVLERPILGLKRYFPY